MRSVAERPLRSRTVVGGSYSSSHGASKSTLLGYRPRTPSDRSSIHFPVPQGPPPRKTNSLTVASSSRVACRGRSPGRFHISDITLKHQRNPEIPHLPLGHHHRSNIVIFHCEVSEFGRTANAHPLFRRGKLCLSFDGSEYGRSHRDAASLEDPATRTTLPFQFLQDHRRLPHVDIYPVSGPHSPGDSLQYANNRQ